VALTVELIPHLDAGDRTNWEGNQDDGPLSALGCLQAKRLARELSGGPIDAFYSSPALRCVQTLEPLAVGAQIVVLDGLRESAPGESELGERVHAALQEIASRHSGGRVVACSHGDAIPALVRFLAAEHGLSGIKRWRGRGQWYTILLSDSDPSINLNQVPKGFPT